MKTSAISATSNYKQRKKLIRLNLIDFSIIFYLLSIFLYVPIVQLQLALFGTYDYNYPLIFVIVIGLITVVEIIRIIKAKMVYFPPLNIALFLFTIFMFLYYLVNSDIHTSVNFVYTKMLPLITFFVIYNSKEKTNVDIILKLIIIVGTINSIFTIAQCISGDLLWQFEKDNLGNNLFYSIRGNVSNALRPPGITTSALGSGYLSILAFFSCLILSKQTRFFTNKNRIVKFAFLILFFLSLLLTQTRNIYLTFAFISISYSFFKCIKLDKKVGYFLSVIISGLYLFFMCFIPLLDVEYGIFSSVSVGIRLDIWARDLIVIKNFNFLEFMFGACKWQEIGGSLYFSDSLYIDLIFSMGIIGFIIYFLFNYFVFVKVYKINDDSSLLIASLVSSILFLGVMNIPLSMYETTIYLVAGIYIVNRKMCKKNIFCLKKNLRRILFNFEIRHLE